LFLLFCSGIGFGFCFCLCGRKMRGKRYRLPRMGRSHLCDLARHITVDAAPSLPPRPSSSGLKMMLVFLLLVPDWSLIVRGFMTHVIYCRIDSGLTSWGHWRRSLFVFCAVKMPALVNVDPPRVPSGVSSNINSFWPYEVTAHARLRSALDARPRPLFPSSAN
jgi:hypothetical protein